MAAARCWTDDELAAFVTGEHVIMLDTQASALPVPDWLAVLAHTDEKPGGPGFALRLTGVHPLDRLTTRNAFMASLDQPGVLIETRTRRQWDGHWRWVRTNRINMVDDPRVGGVLVTLTDEGPVDPRDAGDDLRLTVDHASPTWVIQHLDSIGTILDAEGMVAGLFGMAADRLIGSSALELFDPNAHADIVAVWIDFVEQPGEVRTMQLPLNRPDGDERWVEATFMNRFAADGSGSGSALVIFHDVTEKLARAASERAELQREAERDGLTGVLNRAALDARLTKAIDTDADDADGLVVLFLDLDEFKTINDTCGHDAGDMVLREVAKRLCRAVRPSDIVGRYGGDEFVVMCWDVAADAEAVVVQRVAAVLEDPVAWDGGTWTPRASIGVARRRPGDDVAALLRRADASMFDRKRGGRTVAATR